MSTTQMLVPNEDLDEIWVNLMIVARDSGLSTEEVRQFFRECQTEMEQEQ